VDPIARAASGLSTCLLLAASSLTMSGRSPATVTARNELALARPSETISLSAAEIGKILPNDDLRKVHIRDLQGGRELVAQAVDTDGDGRAEDLVFQSDFAPGETRDFQLTLGTAQVYIRDQFRVYGRFVRERFDDFAWENDRIAHRMYGAALETWEKEPLTSSTVDIWCKRVRRLVVNDWYMVDDYHDDHGEGADFYSAGRSRGCGGSGLWAGGRLWVSRNFVSSKVLANGPVRLIFELTYAPWDVNGRDVSEVKRITLDAGWNLNRFESSYRSILPVTLTYGAGIKKGEGSREDHDAAAGWLRTWEPVRNGQSGNVGCAVVLSPSSLVEIREAEGNYLVVARAGPTGVAAYYAGFGWDRSGDFADENAWAEYVRAMAQRLQSPIKVSVTGASR